jgi:hypothetical protein
MEDGLPLVRIGVRDSLSRPEATRRSAGMRTSFAIDRTMLILMTPPETVLDRQADRA